MHRSTLFRTVACAAFALLVGCSSSTEAPPTVSGTWSGVTDGITFTATLSQSSATVTGNGTMSGPGGSLAFSVNGTFVNPTLSVTITITGFEDANFTGQLDKQAISGTLNGSGFINDPITLTRQ